LHRPSDHTCDVVHAHSKGHHRENRERNYTEASTPDVDPPVLPFASHRYDRFHHRKEKTLSGVTRAEQAQHIECGERVTTTHAEIVQAARNLHHEIRGALGGQTEDIFHHATPSHP